MEKVLPKSSIKGFTLIELMVVVAIIAIISVIGIALYSGAQSNARDSKRKAELEQIASALEINKNNTSYYTTLSKTQFGGGGWPGQEKSDGTQAQDPQGYPYCILTTTNSTSPPWPAETGWAVSPAACATNGGAIINDSLNFSSVNAWTICTRLEKNSGTVFCRSNQQ